jgi:malate dehydrogenase
VGRPTAYTILISNLADKLTVCDTKPGLAEAFAEELKHVTASIKSETKIFACQKDSELKNADIILISAGKPRTPGIKMTRRDLAKQNGKIVKQIIAETLQNNPEAKYVVITNPVDAMAMLCKECSKANYVISTGTNLETLRFKAKLAEQLEVSPKDIEGYVGGEHGTDAVILWSTVKIDKKPLFSYLELMGKRIDNNELDNYVKNVSKQIIDNIGGTEYGPAASFRDIVKAIVNDTQEILPIAAPIKLDERFEPTYVSIPRKLGKTIGPSIYNNLSLKEKEEIKKAAQSIIETYKTAT